MIAQMLVDKFKIFRTTELPEDSPAWVVIAVRADDKRNFVREIHIARRSGLGGIVIATDFAKNDEETDDVIKEKEFREAESWARHHIGNDFLRHPDFEGELKLNEVQLEDVVFSKFDGGLPEAFGKIRDVTESNALREWLEDLFGR